MITRKVKVEVAYNKQTKKYYLYREFRELPAEFRHEIYLENDYYDFEFSKFKNNHELSKTEMKNYFRLNRAPEAFREKVFKEASRLLEAQLKSESEAADDMERAIELSKIVTYADFKNDKLVPIKTKYSRSSWYQNGGQENAPSQYIYLVPASVEKEARELQAIRRKHQGDANFSFGATDYKRLVVRYADHDNDGLNTNIDFETLLKIENGGIYMSEL